MEKTKSKKNILNGVLVCLVAIVISISIVINFVSFLYIKNISQSMDIVKNNVWVEKTNSYDTGSLSFFNNKIEAAKKDNQDSGYIKGELINRSGQRITDATIYFKVYDKNGNLVDWTSDSIKTWDSGEKWVYSAPYTDGQDLKYEFAEFDIAY